MSPMQKPGRNAPCPCGSGLKYKQCCLKRWSGEGPFPIPGNPNWSIVGKPTLRAYTVSEESSPIPEWLLGLARQWTDSASSPDANEADSLHALLLITTAAEAILNRLLEPLVAEAEWERIERKTGVAGKWVLLSEKLNLNPPLSTGSGPLQAFLRVTDARNSLVHFKHGKNLSRSQQEVEAEWEAGHAYVHLTSSKGPPVETPATEDACAVLRPAKAKDYFEAFKTLLIPVLERHPDDHFRIVERLKETLQ